MELSQEFLIDMAINAVGYLLAGVFSVLMFTMFKKKKSTVAINDLENDSQTNKQEIEIDVFEQSETNAKVEFIAFNQNQDKKMNVKRKEHALVIQETKSDKMNRKEAINIAKRMLEAGATHEKIKRILPVSESELALLSLNLK